MFTLVSLGGFYPQSVRLDPVFKRMVSNALEDMLGPLAWRHLGLSGRLAFQRIVVAGSGILTRRLVFGCNSQAISERWIRGLQYIFRQAALQCIRAFVV